MRQPTQKAVGLTRDVGWEVGARRTLAVAPDRAWAALMSRRGRRLWLGDVPRLRLAKGATYRCADGARGEVRAASDSHARLTWQPGNWPRPSTLQVRVLPARGDRCVIAFHQEHLPGAAERRARRAHFQAALDALEAQLAARPARARA